MRIEMIHKRTRGRGVTLGMLGLLLALNSCSKLSEVTIPGLVGPSELGTSLKLTVNPDVITADGFSTASIQATVRDQNGQPAAGRPIFFTISDASGINADIGELNTKVAITGSNGIAQAIYTAPARTDILANTSILVQARPITDDASGQLYRSVRIELRAAETRLFPPNPGNKKPTCSFVTEPQLNAGRVFKPGDQILFQDTSSDPDGTIVRYQWDFGDGTGGEVKPDVNHAYRLAGVYLVSHLVTDNNGAVDGCTATITVR